MTTEASKRKRGFFVKEIMLPSWQVMLMINEESLPQLYDQPYVVVPYTDAKLVRITRRDGEIIKREPYEQKAGQPFMVEPPPPGCTYSLLNKGGTISIFEKKPVNPNAPLPTKPLPKKDPEPLTIIPQNGKDKWYFNVEVLTTPMEWLTGYKFRDPMEAGMFQQDEGQLYDWHEPQKWGMQTIDVRVPVDIAFIDENGVVQDVVPAVPKETDNIEHGVASRAVLETLGGNMGNRGIKKGDVVHHRIFNNALPPPAPR